MKKDMVFKIKMYVERKLFGRKMWVLEEKNGREAKKGRLVTCDLCSCKDTKSIILLEKKIGRNPLFDFESIEEQ